MRIKQAITNTLHRLCAALDNVPTLRRTNSKSWLSIRPRRYSEFGCLLGIAMYAIRLEKKWQIGYWAPKSEGDER